METGHRAPVAAAAERIRFNFDAYADDRRAANGNGDALVEKRISEMTAANDKAARRKALFRSEREKVEAELMGRPLSIEKTFSRLGLLLGTFPPAAIFTRLLLDGDVFRREDFWMLGVAFIVTLISATVGYMSGKTIGRTVFELEQASWSKMILVLPFVGICWGVLAGAAGGIIVFFFGAFLGALAGALVGGIALPIFTIFHRLLKRGDQIEEKHFSPIAFGTALLISAFILGL